MPRVILRVWLPDEPGALGRVAGALGSVGGDLVGIEILERGGGSAIDELDVLGPDDLSLDQLIAAVRAVPGVAVEDARPVDELRPDRGSIAVRLAASIAARPIVWDGLADALVELTDADVAAVVDSDGGLCAIAAAPGREVPDPAWLSAFVGGSRHLGDLSTSGDAHAPTDVAWASMPCAGNTAVVVRSGRPFHRRERDDVSALADVAAAVIRRDAEASVS